MKRTDEHIFLAAALLLARRQTRNNPYELVNSTLTELGHEGVSNGELEDAEQSIPEEAWERLGW